MSFHLTQGADPRLRRRLERATLWSLVLISLLLQDGCRKQETDVVSVNAQPASAEPARDLDSKAAGKLPVYQLKIAPNDLMALENASYSNDTHPATFIADGKSYPDAKVRIRGSWSRSWPKKSLKIIFDHNNPFEGRHTLNLNSGWHDPAFVREPLAYYVYA
ncbi:MAG TPA: CotH kinase family protein, partial [Verrucomicrobiae bacterium]|nr:CotH kinase family protein [Verrucomicrobiae bacterium]